MILVTEDNHGIQITGHAEYTPTGYDRDTLKQECYGAFFGGGFGGTLVESFDFERTVHEELVELTLEIGIDLNKCQT